MIYKAFAAVTLIAAPIVVITVQSFMPQTNPSAPPVSVSPTAAPASAPVQPAPPAPVSAPPADAASFGQPMPDAGKPFLTPGTGLPDTAAAPPAGPIEEPSSDLNSVAR